MVIHAYSVCNDNYFELMDLKSWLHDKDALDHNDDARDQLIHRLVDDKLRDCRRPRGVIVAAAISDVLYVSYSLCNFASGDEWNKHIALCKAMRRVKIKPCPAVYVSADDGIPKITPSPKCSYNDLGEWVDQFPQSTRSAVIRFTKRVIEQHLADKSVLITDILPVAP